MSGKLAPRSYSPLALTNQARIATTRSPSEISLLGLFRYGLTRQVHVLDGILADETGLRQRLLRYFLSLGRFDGALDRHLSHRHGLTHDRSLYPAVVDQALCLRLHIGRQHHHVTGLFSGCPKRLHRTDRDGAIEGVHRLDIGTGLQEVL